MLVKLPKYVIKKIVYVLKTNKEFLQRHYRITALQNQPHLPGNFLDPAKRPCDNKLQQWNEAC
jgi:hypothetical protein